MLELKYLPIEIKEYIFCYLDIAHLFEIFKLNDKCYRFPTLNEKIKFDGYIFNNNILNNLTRERLKYMYFVLLLLQNKKNKCSKIIEHFKYNIKDKDCSLYDCNHEMCYQCNVNLLNYTLLNCYLNKMTPDILYINLYNLKTKLCENEIVNNDNDKFVCFTKFLSFVCYLAYMKQNNIVKLMLHHTDINKIKYFYDSISYTTFDNFVDNYCKNIINHLNKIFLNKNDVMIVQKKY